MVKHTENNNNQIIFVSQNLGSVDWKQNQTSICSKEIVFHLKREIHSNNNYRKNTATTIERKSTVYYLGLSHAQGTAKSLITLMHANFLPFLNFFTKMLLYSSVSNTFCSRLAFSMLYRLTSDLLL